jgi:hypothetical protein
MSFLGQLLNAGKGSLPGLVRLGIKNADDLAGRLMPAVLQTGDRVLVERTTNALRNLGARVPSLPGPGLLGPQRASSAVRPAPSQLPQSIRGFVGPSPTPPPARAAVPATPAPGVRGVPALAQNRPPAPLAEAPTPPVRYPAPAPASETARQITMLKPGRDEVGSMGTRLTYRAGTPGVDGRLGSTTYGQGAEIGASSVYPRIPAGASAQEQMRLSSQLNRGPSTAELPGTPLLRTQGSNQYVAPRPAFGPGAADEVFDRTVDVAFGGSRGGGVGAQVLQGGRGGALVRSPGGEMVDELMIDPVRVREIFESAPELLGSLRNAAGGIQTGDLGALLSNPAIRAAVGAGGLGALGFGLAGIMDTDRTGETTAGSPPSPPLFTEDGRTPLGDTSPAAPVYPPATGNIDPSVAAPTVTGGNLQQQSATREALAQHAPGAAAVMRASEPMSPERYGSIEDYYAARAAYAGSADKQRELMRFMEGQSQTLGKSLAEWAESNPALAYEFQRRQLVNQAANQQSAEAVTTRNYPTSPMGSETAANAVGNAEATAQAAVDPSQAAVEMREATRMQVQPNLQRVQEFIQRQAPRAAMYGGY